MTLEAHYRYDASVQTLYELLVDLDFLRRNYELLGAQKIDFTEYGQEGEIFLIAWLRDMPTAGGLSRWDEMIEWSSVEGGVMHADYLGRIKGSTETLAGEIDLFPQADGCRMEITLQASRLQTLSEADLRQALASEDALIRQYLADSRA